LNTEVSGWLSSWASVEAKVPMALTRDAWMSSAWMRRNSSSERLRSVMSR
jgi:hypothetical protein